jgi:ATP-binding cassette subfamily A (ABC1) protein 3
MYESILKVATEDPEFEFKVRTSGYPIIGDLDRLEQTRDIGTIITFCAIAFPVFLAVVVTELVTERVTLLKHFQGLNGMRSSAYWCSKLLTDILKLYTIIGISILMFTLFGYEFESSIVVLALFPWGVLPFTYVISFCFTSPSLAQTMVMVLHFVAILVLSTLVFVLRLTNQLEVIGDRLNYVMRIIPSYSISQSLYFETSGDIIVGYRERTDGTGLDLNEDPWHQTNNLFDI